MLEIVLQPHLEMQVYMQSYVVISSRCSLLRIPYEVNIGLSFVK